MQLTRQKLSTPKKFIKNFYAVTTVSFLLWILFFDANSILFCWQMDKKRKELKKQEEFYQSEIQRIEKILKILSSDTAQLEKFAREKYFFKRKGEDIFLIERRKADNF